MHQISMDDFDKVELRAGTILSVEVLAKARKPAYKLKIDFGDDIGVLQSSAQLTDIYTAEELIGKQVIGVINFPPKRIAGFKSEALTTGFDRGDGAVVLAVPDHKVPNGSKLF